MIGAQEDAVAHEVTKRHLRERTKFDVVLMYGMCEVGLYIGRRIFDAKLIYLVI